MNLRRRFWKAYGVFTATNAIASLIQSGLEGFFVTTITFAGLSYVISEFLFPYLEKFFSTLRSESN